MTARLVAKGEAIWKKLAELKNSDFQPARNVDVGVGTATIQPRTRFAGIFFVTCIDPSNCLYIQDNELYSAGQRDLFQGKLLEEIGRKAAKAEWAIDLYKITMSVMYEIALPLKAAGYAVKAFSAIVFFEKHEGLLKTCYGDLQNVLKSLKKLLKNYPKLAAAMLAAALQSTLQKVKTASKKQGILKLIDSNLDWSKFVEDVAVGIAKILKSLVKGAKSGASAIAAWITQRGLRALAAACTAAYKIFKALKTWRSMPKAPGVKDKHKLATELLKEFGKAGVTLTHGEALGILDESTNDQARTQLMHALKWQTSGLSERVTKVFELADKEMF